VAATLERSIIWHPEHISAYGLTYEEDTEFFRRLGRNEMAPDEGIEADQFELTTSYSRESAFDNTKFPLCTPRARLST